MKVISKHYGMSYITVVLEHENVFYDVTVNVEQGVLSIWDVGVTKNIEEGEFQYIIPSIAETMLKMKKDDRQEFRINLILQKIPKEVLTYSLEYAKLNFVVDNTWEEKLNNGLLHLWWWRVFRKRL